ncbi:MAG: XkdX family protein [Clostridiales bacterium]|nr:XkdX family protein [Clostridiales bacterium]
MSSNYTKVRNYYRFGMWSIDRVRNAVSTGWITEEEFTLITGEDY